MKKLKDFRKEMLEYAKEVVDLEAGESPKDWVDAYVDAMREDGMIFKIGRTEYVAE